MARLNIELVADAQKALDGLNDVTESTSSLLNQLIKAEGASDDFADALSRDLAVAADKAGYGLKGLQAQLKELMKYQERARQGLGESSDVYKTINALVKEASTEIKKLNDAKSKEASSTDIAKKANDEYAASLERINTAYNKYLNGKTRQGTTTNITYDQSNIRFYQQIGDSAAVAREELKMYEAQLRRVLDAENASPAAIEAATNAYKQQKEVVQSLNKEHTDHGSKLLSVAKNILKFQLLMGPITAAIRGFKNTISESVKVAAEAEQIFNKLSTVFSNVADSARKAAEEIASSLGVANSTAASALSTVGDLLQAQGMGTASSLSTASGWVKQFQDIIAFKDINMTLEEFAQNFMSGAAGNLRNFRTFGSIVKESAVNARLAAEGYDKLTGSELELAKMTTRATLALEQQKNAMGATEREWDSMLSINRRYEEQNKKLKENLGDMLNSIVKPMKEVWTEILETINRAIEAKKRFQRGETTDYDMSNESDRRLFDEKALALTGVFSNSYLGNGMGLMNSTLSTERGLITKSITETDESLKAFDEILAFYNADVAYLRTLLGDKLSESFYGLLEDLETERNALREETEQRKALLEARAIETETVAGSFDNFLETLMGIKGVGSSIHSADTLNANSHMSFARQLAIEARQAGIDAFNNINASDLTDFVDAVSLALGEVTEEDMVKNKAESLRSLYSALFNQFTKDKTLQENADLLERIANEYKAITAENVELKNDWDDLLKKIQEATSSSAESLSRLRFEHGLSGTDAENARSLAYYDALAGKSSYAAQLRELGMAAQDAEEYAQAWYDIQIAIANEEYDYAVKTLELEKQKTAQAKLQEAYNNAMASIAGVRSTNTRNAFAAGLSNDAAGNYSLALYDILSQTTAFTNALIEAGYALEDAEDLAYIYRTELEKGARATYDAAVAQEMFTATQNGLKASDLMRSFRASILPSMSAKGKYAEADNWMAGQKSSLRSTEAQLLTLGVAASEVNAFIAEMIPLINEEYEAKKKEIDATEEAAEALKRIQAWEALRDRAIGSTGTLGGVIQSFQGEGDIWTKILNAILTILENTKGWQDIASTLDQIFAMFEPVVDGLIDLILSLPWEDIIFMLKVIASAITTIMAVVQTFQEIINWLWDNIKAAFSWVATKIYNLFHPFNKKDLPEFRSWNDLTTSLQQIGDATIDRLDRIWAVNEKIERNTSNDDPLKVLNDLRARGIINDSQYLKGARVVQKDMVFDPVSADTVNYVGSRQPDSTSISYGNITININGGDPAEIERTLNRYFERQGIHYNMPLAMGGY